MLINFTGIPEALSMQHSPPRSTCTLDRRSIKCILHMRPQRHQQSKAKEERGLVGAGGVTLLNKVHSINVSNNMGKQ